MSLRRGIVPTAELSADSISVDAAQQPKLDDTVPPEPWPTWPRQKRWEPEHEMQKQALVCINNSCDRVRSLSPFQLLIPRLFSDACR